MVTALTAEQVNSLLHRLWGKAKESPDYDKREWQLLESVLLRKTETVGLTERMVEYRRALLAGELTINQVREREGLPPIESAGLESAKIQPSALHVITGNLEITAQARADRPRPIIVGGDQVDITLDGQLFSCRKLTLLLEVGRVVTAQAEFFPKG